MSNYPIHRVGELGIGVAAALGLFDPPKELDEKLLARVIRELANDINDLRYRMFLKALAAALDDPEAEMRLTLKMSRRGRVRTGGMVPRAFVIGPYVEKMVKSGWKKEAAVQQAMTAMKVSRSTVLRSCSEYKKLRLVFKDDPSV